MQLSELIRSLRLEYSDAGASPSLDDAQLKGAVTQALAALKKDVKRVYLLTDTDLISPSPDAEDQALLHLYALAVVCRMMQAATARGFSFSSGDKRIDKTRQPSYWAELGRNYFDQYRQAVSDHNPEYGLGVPAITPLLYGGDTL